MDWRVVDERLIKRGEILLGIDFLDAYDVELITMNIGKVVRPFNITDGYMSFLAVVRYLFHNVLQAA